MEICFLCCVIASGLQNYGDNTSISLFSSNIDVEYDQAKNKGCFDGETDTIDFKTFCLM